MDSIAGDLARYGVPLVGLNVLLQQLGLPIPAVPTMMLAGALAMAGRIDLLAAFAIAVLASLVADLLWYWAGRRYGYRVLRFTWHDVVQRTTGVAASIWPERSRSAICGMPTSMKCTLAGSAPLSRSHFTIST